MAGRVLIVDDLATNRLILRAKLSSAYFQVEEAADGLSALEICRSLEPDLVLLDIELPDIDGYEVCTRLKSDAKLQHIPVVMITGARSSAERIRGLKAGADDFLTKPYNDLTLLARVRNLVRFKVMHDELALREQTMKDIGLDDLIGSNGFSESIGAQFMIISDHGAEASAWLAAITSWLDYDYVRACPEMLGDFDGVGDDLPDLLLLDQSLGDGGDFLNAIAAMRARRETRAVAIIAIIRSGGIETAGTALELGANDYLIAPFDRGELIVRVRSQMRRKLSSDLLKDNVRHGLQMAILDPLTGLYNRRYAMSHLEKICDAAAASHQQFAVMLIDVDHFKKINDCFGHEAGDQILREIASRLQQNLRGMDLIARIGGEEFLVVLPDCNLDFAHQIAERIRFSVAAAPFMLGDCEALDVTASLGLTLGGRGEYSVEAALRRADIALYQAKSNGRNRVTLDRKIAA